MSRTSTTDSARRIAARIAARIRRTAREYAEYATLDAAAITAAATNNNATYHIAR